MPCEGCGMNEATLQCPTCKKLGLPPSFFHSQDCFKAHWAQHKVKHTQPQQLHATIPTMTQHDAKMFNFTGPLRPGLITPRRAVPPQIVAPDYATRADGISPCQQKQRGSYRITVHSIKHLHDDHNNATLRAQHDILKIKHVCALSRQVLNIACSAVKAGITTDALDKLVHDQTIARGMYPSPLNYYCFPKSVCTSVNEVICHGIPDNRVLQEGDIVNLDVSSYLQGFHGDLNETVFVGKPDAVSVNLVHTAYASMMAGISVVKPDELYKHIGDAIEARAQQSHCSVVRTYTGHGVGKLFHSSPSICHYRDNKTPSIMKVGHVFTIEPMINVGVWQDVTWPDKWTSTTKDGKRSAQFQHTMVCTQSGAELLTDWKDGIPFYQKQLKEWQIDIPAIDPNEVVLTLTL